MQAAGVEKQGKRRRIIGQNLDGVLPLGINTKFATTKKSAFDSQDYHKRRDFRAFLAVRQKQEVIKSGNYSRFKTLCNCSQYAVPLVGRRKDGSEYLTGSPGKVQMVWHEDGTLSTTWARRCASPLLCFECAPKIRYFRSTQVQKVCLEMYRKGYSWQFWTFTAPHDLGTDPDSQVKAMREAYRKMVKDRRWKLFRERCGLCYTISAVELTDDGPDAKFKTGCHFHFHIIAFFDHLDFSFVNIEFPEKKVEEMREFISRRWVECLLSVGAIDSDHAEKALQYAFRLDVPRQPVWFEGQEKRRAEFADLYRRHVSGAKLTKNQLEALNREIEKAAAYVAKGAACEMTPGIFTKNARVEGRISHWELMALAFTTRPSLVPRALAVMQALKGRRWISFSPGLLALCGVKDLADEDILKKKDDASVYSFDDDEWKAVSRFRSRTRLVRRVKSEVVDMGIDLADRPPVDEKGKFLPSVTVDRVAGAVSYVMGVVEDGRDPITTEKLAEGQAPSWVKLE